MVARSLHRFDPVGLGAWTLTTRVGTGTGTVVYRAVDRHGRQAAVKAPLPYSEDHTVLSRLAHEARVLDGLRVAGMARLLEDGSGAPLPYLAVELVDGPSLRAIVDRRGPLLPTEVEALGRGMAGALAGLHRNGVIHADLKPANVLLGRAGPVVIDFDAALRLGMSPVGGEALHACDEPTSDMALRASPSWLAPEQAIGDELTFATDVFAWGALVVFLATGRGPFGMGDPAAMLYRVVHEAPNLSGLGAHMAAIVGAALAKQPSTRPSAAAIVKALTRLADRRRMQRDAARAAA